MPSTLESLHSALNARSIPCTLTGELSSIMSFTNAPLSYTLRIAGSKTSTTVLVIKSQEFTSNAFRVINEDYLAELCVWVSNFQSEKEREAASGQMRLVPRTDSALLGILQKDIETSNLLEPFAPAHTMVEWGHLLDAVVTLFAPFGLQPDFSAPDSVSFGVKELITNGYCAGPKIFRLKKYGFEGEIRGGLNLSTCVTLLYARNLGPAHADADRNRMLSRMLVEAEYVGELAEDDFMPLKVLLYDLAKADDRRALVERVLLIRDLEREGQPSFEKSKWMGKQKRYYMRIDFTPDEKSRPAARAYHLRKEAGKGSRLREDITDEDINFGAKERVVERSPRPPTGGENPIEVALWKELERFNESRGLMMEQTLKRERDGGVVPELTREEDEETVGPVTPPASPFTHAFNMVEEDEDEDGGIRLHPDTLPELGQ
ncbi:hypothetical protein P171DRAFT_287293 [Karstenula rhodostoma CBS 690.94]|uniref:Uncharacterized protein n=1 Tax=Karstenula rhodostoma CBS 690.94 TaxID=1392251 RepID=A0A9P4PJ46_9PLEO|nr:hypothetical protein P171DRAFT_287293 [Karstenula rhodostoma CBS 690.94]